MNPLKSEDTMFTGWDTSTKWHADKDVLVLMVIDSIRINELWFIVILKWPPLKYAKSSFQIYSKNTKFLENCELQQSY